MLNILKKLINYINDLKQKSGGSNPYFNLFASQFLATYQQNAWVESISYQLEGGKLLDYGCGGKPYKHLFKNVSYLGADIIKSETVDFQVIDGYKLNIYDNELDSLISTQVLEHVENVDKVIIEWKRVLKKGSNIYVSVPFLFNNHGYPFDFRRYTKEGLINKFQDQGFIVSKVFTVGGIGSTLVLNLQNWIDSQTGKIAILLKTLLFPFHFIYMPLLNIAGMLLNKFDNTNAFYTSTCLELSLNEK